MRERWASLPRWSRRVALLGLGVVSVLVVGRLVVGWLDRADPVEVDRVVAEFNTRTESTTSVVPGEDGEDPTVARPATGAFVYEASGREFLSILGGPLHEFPEQVVVTNEANDCGGITSDLQLFEQRNDVLVLCETESGSLALDSFVTRHEFVGVADTTTSRCEDPLDIWWPGITEDDIGYSNSVDSCVSNGDMVSGIGGTITIEIVAFPTLQVNGSPVETVHTRLTSTFGAAGDANHGNYTVDFWTEIDSGIVVQRTLDAIVTAETPLGAISFEEGLELELAETD